MPLDRPISTILTEPGRNWTPEPPASKAQLQELWELAPLQLPAEYLELLRFCNGGDGDLDLPPLMFQLDSIADALFHNEMWRKDGQYTNFWFFGSNGGLESIAFDLRTGPPYAIVMMDTIAGDDSAIRIADDIANFILKIGIPAAGQKNGDAASF